jgi:hypothetical protein
MFFRSFLLPKIGTPPPMTPRQNREVDLSVVLQASNGLTEDVPSLPSVSKLTSKRSRKEIRGK